MTPETKILVFQPNYTTFDLDVAFILFGMAGAAGELPMPRQMATDL
jgi:hypothetical protein